MYSCQEEADFYEGQAEQAKADAYAEAELQRHNFNKWNVCDTCNKSVEDYESVEKALKAECKNA